MINERDFINPLTSEEIMNKNLIRYREANAKWCLDFSHPQTKKRIRKTLPFEYHQRKEAHKHAIKVYSKLILEQETRDLFAEYTFIDAVQEYKSFKPREATDIGILKDLSESIGNKDLKLIKRNDYNKLISKWRYQLNTNDTINRKLDILKAVLNMAVRNDVIEAFPKIIDQPTTKEKLSYRYTDEDLSLLLSHMTGDYEYLIDPFLFAVGTGLRKENVISITKHHIFKTINGNEIRFRPNEMKSKRAFSLPITNSIQTIIDRNLDEDREYLFKGYKGKPKLGDPRRAFKTIRERAGIINPKKQRLAEWRDLRGTRASFLAEKGVGVFELMKIMDWTTIETAQYYVEMFAPNIRNTLEQMEDSFVTEIVTKNNCCNKEINSYNVG